MVAARLKHVVAEAVLPADFARLTATVTATATAEGWHQRSTSAQHTCAPSPDIGHVRPEKQTVEDRSRSAVTAANTAAKPLDNTCRGWIPVECRTSAQTAADGPGRYGYSCQGTSGLPCGRTADLLAGGQVMSVLAVS